MAPNGGTNPTNQEMNAWVSHGERFIAAIARQDFREVEHLIDPMIHFRALLPSKEAEAHTNVEAASWFKHWFGNRDSLELQYKEVTNIFDRLYLTYRIRTHHPEDGWRVIEQHIYAVVQNGKIADLWLLCSGFRPEAEKLEQSNG